MKIAKLISSRDGGGADGATTMIPPTPRIGVNDDETQATSGRIEILLERENHSPIKEKHAFHGDISDFRLDGSSGVEVVTVPVAPILSSDTSFTISKTFGDDSMIAEVHLEHLSIVGSKQHDNTAGRAEDNDHHSANRERIEMALDSDQEPLYKRLWGFVPLTPRGLRQQELNVVIDEENSPQDVSLNENAQIASVLAEFHGQSVEDSSKHKTVERGGFEEDTSIEKTTGDVDTAHTLILQGKASTSSDIGYSPRFIGRMMNTTSPVQLSTAIDSVPTYDTRMGIIKEQFEATIDCSSATKEKKWKSVAFGLGLSNPHNSIKGNVKSILRLRPSDQMTTGTSTSTISDSGGPKADNEHSTDEGTNPSPGPIVEFKPKEGSTWPRRRVPSFTRPYLDRGSTQEGVELVKHSFGSRQHSFLRSITFDEEQVGQRRAAERIGNWMPLRRSRSDIIKTNLEDSEGDEVEPNENESDALAMPMKFSIALKYRQTDQKKADGGVPHQLAGTPSEKDGSVIVQEYFLPMDHDGMPQHASVLGESTAANMETLKVVQCPVVQSTPLKTPNKLRRNSSATVKVDRVTAGSSNHHYYRHEEKKPGGIFRLGKALATSDLTEIERKIQEVAKARMRPDQSLQDALDELEVELMEARNGTSREIRDTMFRRIRNQTHRLIIERGGASKPGQPDSEFH